MKKMHLTTMPGCAILILYKMHNSLASTIGQLRAFRFLVNLQSQRMRW